MPGLADIGKVAATATGMIAGDTVVVVDTAAAEAGTAAAEAGIAAAEAGTAVAVAGIAVVADTAAGADMGDTAVDIAGEGMRVWRYTSIHPLLKQATSSVGQTMGIVAGAGIDHGLVTAGQRWRYRQNS